MLEAIPRGEAELRSGVWQQIVIALVALGDLDLAVQSEVNITDSSLQKDTRLEIIKRAFRVWTHGTSWTTR